MRGVPLVAAAVLVSTLCASALAEGPLPKADDAAISVLVESALSAQAALAHTHITVRTRNGVVTLGGFARSLDDIETAGRVARGVPGVRSVTNGIRVSDRPSRA